MSASPRSPNLPKMPSSRNAVKSSRSAYQSPNPRVISPSSQPQKRKSQVVSLTGRPVSKFPTTVRRVPLLVRSLRFIHRSSSILAGSLIGTTLLIYAWTFETQQQWSQEYQNLEQLLRYERQTTPFKENIKEQLANEAEDPEAGLIPPDTDHLIFLRRPETTVAETSTTSPSNNSRSSRQPEITPLGY